MWGIPKALHMKPEQSIPIFPTLLRVIVLMEGGIDGGVHGGQGVDFCWGDWLVFKTVCVDDVGGEHFGCGGDGGWDGVRHWEGSFLWIIGELRERKLEKVMKY